MKERKHYKILAEEIKTERKKGNYSRRMKERKQIKRNEK